MDDYLAFSELYIPVRGGHVVWLHEVCRRLSSVFVVAGKCGRSAGTEEVEGVPARRVDFSRKWYLRPESLAMYLRMYRVGLEEARRRRPKVLLAARGLPEGVVANRIRRKTGIPTVMFAHGEEINRSMPEVPLPRRHRFRVRHKRKQLWRAFCNADAIIANSHFTRGLLTEGGVDPERVHVIHPGTDAQRFSPGPKPAELARELGVEGRKVVLSVGRLSVRKGQDRTIEAWPDVLAKQPDAVYLVAGTGENDATLRSLAERKGVADRVRFLGAITDEMLPDLYRLADVFIMASRQLPDSHDVEGFGIVFLEAAATGVPVVAGRCGGVPDAVEHGETGLLVDGDSSEEIARAVISLLQDDMGRSQMGRSGRRRVCDGLTWEHSAASIQSLTKDVASGRATTRD